MNLKTIHRVFFVGIGGIGMSALARFFVHIGKEVAGYDKTETPLTLLLQKEGMIIHYTDDLSMVPSDYRKTENLADTLIIYTPAIPSQHAELNFFKDKGYTVMKRAQVLGLITQSYRGIAVAGSHGKSTLSAMVATIFAQKEPGCSAFLGAISKNLNSNLMLSSTSEWAVMEADEFDRSFLWLEPELALVTSMDPDHLDIYEEGNQLKISFEDFLAKVKKGSTVIIKKGVDLLPSPAKELKHLSYSLDIGADYYPVDIVGKGLGYHFKLMTPKGAIENCQTQVPGWINIENAVGAAALALEAGLPPDQVRQGIASFTGVKRRFDVIFKGKGKYFIDDYAHHPKEIKALVSSIRKLFPNKTILGIFQPHLFTRTRDFAQEFADELSQLDHLLLMDIYPAREEPIKGVSSHLILDQIKGIPKKLVARDEILDEIKNSQWEVLLTIGAGNIDREVQAIAALLNEMDS